MTERGPSEKYEVAGMAPVRSRKFAALSLLLAVVLAGTVIAAAWALSPSISLYLVVSGAVLSFAGLFALFGWMAGLIRFGGQSQTSAFFDGLTDAIGDACVVADGKARAVYGNAPYLKLASEAGVNRLVGFDLLYAGQAAFIEPIYQLAQAALEGKSESREIRLGAGASAPGASPTSPKWLKMSVAPIMEQSRRGYVLWRLQDISVDRAKQEQAFGRLQFIITYLDRAPAGFFSSLPSKKVDYLNATLAEWLGFDVAESQSGELQLKDVLGEEGARQVAAIEPVASGGRTELFSLDLKSKTGSILPVDVIHRVDFDANLKMLPARTLIVPRRERALGSDDNEALSRFVGMAPIGIAEIDDKGIIQSANSIFLSYSPKARRGGSLDAMVADGDRAELQAGLAKFQSQHTDVVLVDATMQDDRPRLVQFSFARLHGEGKHLTVFAVDRTESKTLEVQLAQSQKMQAVGQLASGIAHDFNNVLTPIIGFADLLLAKMRPTDPAFADVMNIKQNANRAANLVRQLLAFSRKQTLQPKVHSLTDAMSDLGNLLGRVLGEKVELKISHSRDLGLVLVDIHQFEQVIINLAVNARDAMPKGGTLYVSTRNVSEEESRTVLRGPMPPGEYVVCEVTDTGSGIPADIVEKIWEPFFSTKEVGKGTGLGLSTVYGIVKQTGGFIYCDSEIGKGTTFSIYLPRHYPKPVDPSVVAAKEEVKEKRADLTGKGRILLVEDEDAVRAFAIRALSSRGYTVIEADSGESALAVMEAQSEPFDLILSDVVMPEMDGPTLLRELRKRGVTTRVIFVSGYAEDAFEKNLEGQTDFAFLPKPFSLKQLVEKVKEVMEG
jgi:two-component system, cell cycle sensor histidine kinase and response regulator CckA